MVRHIPVSVLLSFPAPNYVDPVTRGPSLVVVNAIFIALVTVIVLARLYTRIFIKRWFGSDDVFIILAFVSGFNGSMLSDRLENEFLIIVFLLELWSMSLSCVRFFANVQHSLAHISLTKLQITTIGLTVNVIIANTSCYWDRHVWDIPISSLESPTASTNRPKLLSTNLSSASNRRFESCL